MKLILFLSSLFLLACYGDYNDNTCGILSLCGIVLCMFNPKDNGEGAESVEELNDWENVGTEQGIGTSNL